MTPLYSKQATKYINALDAGTQQRIRTAINKLPNGDTKLIKGRGIATYRLRVGDWRVLYSFEGNNILIEKIAPRGDIYKGV
ncbi:MAG: type II toxin-antitoxin system RelE/ParE family toxin [Defluviitaleaceae bacterium]|nr:type II toxin-antitoxin system RelE/ParE family toxin [Defluviitaleaceae bacterium]